VTSNELSVCRTQWHFVRPWLAQMASAGTGDRGALEDYHKRVPDSPGLEQDRLRRVLDIRVPGPAFDATTTAMVRRVSFGARGRGSSCLVTPSD
jgi:Elongation factor SelB, winged helix